MRFTGLLAGVAFVTGAIAYTLPDVPKGSFRVRIENGTEIHEQLLHGSDNHWRSIASFENGAGLPVPRRLAIRGSEISRRSSTDCNDLNTGMYARKGCFTTWCGCAFPLNHGDTDAAVADLKVQANKYGAVGHPFLAHYYICGGTIAFACNTEPYDDAPYNSWFVTKIFHKVTEKCGLYISGTAIYEDIVNENPFPDIGYMQSSAGLKFCDTDRSSKEGTC